MAVGTKIKFRGRVHTVRHFKNNWGIVQMSVDKPLCTTEIYTNRFNELTVVGVMPEPLDDMEYQVTAKETQDPKWGRQYEIINMSSLAHFDKDDAEGRKKYLERLYTPGQVKALYAALDDPFETLQSGNTEELVKTKGVGVQTANRMITKFHQNYSYSKLYLELEEYELTQGMITRLLNSYHSADLAIAEVKKNPYALCSCNGIGWKSADKIALAAGIKEHDPKRVSAFINYYLSQVAYEGMSYVLPDQLMDAICENLGEDMPDLVISDAIHSMDNLWYDKDKTKIGLKYYRDLAQMVARELHRIAGGENTFKYGDWENIVNTLEEKQGWQHTDEQREGIKMGLQNNLCCIIGGAGTGKSTSVKGVTQVLKDYSIATCSLSGRAAARIAFVTGEQGYTIHRLLGFPSKDFEAKNSFFYHDENPLPYDIVVLDETSMVNAALFYKLIRAIRTGAKLICLGDDGQLESIGEGNVLYDMIHSPYIPTIQLTKIHRQAAKSAIITDSLAIRNGQQIIPKDWAGMEVRGELQDLLLDCYSDQPNTYFKVMEHFVEEFEKVDSILDIQVICPIKNKGTSCTRAFNEGIQAIYNPAQDDAPEMILGKQGERYIVRVGDKVINRVNKYDAQYLDGSTTAIFNGDVGIVKEIWLDENSMLVDFVGKGEIVIPSKHLPAIELAYAITVHSSQGDQYENVIVAIDFSAYVMLTRELLYTAITRAQKHCTLVAQNSALRYATAQASANTKYTHLQDCIEEVFNPKMIF